MNKKAFVFAGMGFELVGLILAGLYLGKLLDEKYNLGGLATAGLAFLVLASWLWHLVILLKRFMDSGDDSAHGRSGKDS